MSNKKATEIERISREAKEWLFPNDLRDYSQKWNITMGAIYAILSGRLSGKRTIDRLFEMHRKAEENKKNLESRTINEPANV